MKKLFSIVILLVVCSVLFVGCGQPVAPSYNQKWVEEEQVYNIKLNGDFKYATTNYCMVKPDSVDSSSNYRVKYETTTAGDVNCNKVTTTLTLVETYGSAIYTSTMTSEVVFGIFPAINVISSAKTYDTHYVILLDGVRTHRNNHFKTTANYKDGKVKLTFNGYNDTTGLYDVKVADRAQELEVASAATTIDNEMLFSFLRAAETDKLIAANGASVNVFSPVDQVAYGINVGVANDIKFKMAYKGVEKEYTTYKLAVTSSVAIQGGQQTSFIYLEKNDKDFVTIGTADILRNPIVKMEQYHLIYELADDIVTKRV